jgi:hypothetical protein
MCKQHLCRPMTMNLFQKYKIEKCDGSPVDARAQYFVLRIDTDPHSRAALLAYAKSIRSAEPLFALELQEWVRSHGAKKK